MSDFDAKYERYQELKAEYGNRYGDYTTHTIIMDKLEAEGY